MVLIIAVFVSLIGQSLSWYNHFYVSICLYGTAAAAKIILIHTLAKRFYYVVSNRLFFFFFLLLGKKVKWAINTQQILVAERNLALFLSFFFFYLYVC